MRRLLAIVTVPVLVTVAVIGVTGAQRAMAAPADGQGCILGVICLPDPSSPTPTPGSSSPAPSPSSASPTATTPAGSPTLPVPVPSVSVPLPGVPPVSPTSGLGGLLPSLGASPGASGSDKPKQADATPGLEAAAAPGTLTADTAHITGFHYVGNVDVPTASGPRAMMKFTADSIDLTGNVTVVVTENGNTVTTVSAEQNFTDGVTLYATQISGTLVAATGLPGVPLTFSPATLTVASLLKLPNAGELQLANLVTGAIPLTLTGVTTEHLLISGGSQVTTQLSMS